MSILSDRLRQLRGTTSQAEMARQLGIQRPQWIKYENGTTSPGAEMLSKICRVHAVSADWLLGLPTARQERPPNPTPDPALKELAKLADALSKAADLAATANERIKAHKV